ncbi:MAG: DEAD/DEAH box helicase [Deltaproteobacteria bacterium]|nr:DEAD/DEAH box helicase [Deltaproteobacteria bacterium]
MTAFCATNPLIVQGDHTILVEVDNPLYPVVRDQLVRFAELVKSPEHIHTYRITPLSIWNACAAGVKAAEITDVLDAYAKYAVPAHVNVEIRDFATRYGRLRLTRREGSEDLLLSTNDLPLAEEISRNRHVAPFLAQRLSPTEFSVNPFNRGRIKQALIKTGFPAEDLAGYIAGESMSLALRGETLSQQSFVLRPYQLAAAEIFHAGGSDRGGSGVIVLPCGAGKTIVGMACMSQIQSSTLILTTSVTAIRQWTAELLDKTTLTKDDIGEYSGSVKNIRPVTLATYQIMTYRTRKEEDFPHLTLFNSRSWGLIIYDEVHLLPAPVFQITASIQARRRLGLTATLVREDGREDDVFALIGPKKVDIPWKEMESQGWIAEAKCHEIRLPLKEDLRMPYALADARQKFRIASENPDKQALVRKILKRHEGEQVLLIGLYIDQIKDIASELQIPLLTGTTAQRKRDAVYADFKEGRVKILAVSKIANFAVDLPDASVAIQISGTFGSRQEEAQRLGRILRPKNGRNQAHFYNLVTRDTVEQDFALKRQLFLCEQGYEYVILDAAELQ